MTVKEMMLKLLADAETKGDSPDIDFCDDYDERAYIAYCGNHFSEKALEKYADGFNLPIDEEATNLSGKNGYPIVIVHCEKSKDANALRNLLYSMAGYLETEEEYNELYPEPEDDEPVPEHKPAEVDICYFAYKQEVYNDSEDTNEETCVQGYWSGTDENRFFRDISKMICFSDCEPREIVEIVWHGKKVRYSGWKPGMLFKYEDESGNMVWEGCFPEWDH